MEWGNISSGTVLASGVVSAIISSIFGVWQKKIDYRNSYYKIVLDKRMAAYEKIQNILSHFFTIKYYDYDGNYYYCEIDTKEKLHVIRDKIKNCISDGLFISLKMFSAIRELDGLLQNCDNNNQDILICNIKKSNEDIKKILENASNTLNSDLLELYDVPKFLCESRHKNWFHKKISHIPIARDWID